MRRVLSIILLLSLLLSFAPAAMASEAEEVCEITCITNTVSSTVPVPCRSVDGVAYIPEEFAAVTSGWDYIDSDGKPEFMLEEQTVLADRYIQDEQGVFWVPIGSTLEQLQAEVAAFNGCLIVRAKTYTADELIARTEAVFHDKENIDRWRITSVDGGHGNAGVIFANLFNATTQWKLVDALTGEYTRDNYKKAFALIMAKDKAEGEKDTDLMAVLKDVDGYLDVLSELEQKSVKAEDLDDIMKQFSYGNLTDGEALLAMYKEATDPLGKELGGNVELGGLDLGAQLEIIEYMVSIRDASSFYVDMVDNVFFAECLKNPYGWGPAEMIEAAKDVVKYYRSDSYSDIISEVLTQEIVSAMVGTLNQTAENATGILANTLAIERIVIDSATDLLGGEKPSEIMANVEINYCLAQIQKSAKALYNVYAHGANDPVRAKYAALLYLRCSLAWSYLYEEQVPEADFVSYREGVKKHMAAIMEISDYDLTHVAENEEIAYEAVRPVTDIEEPAATEPEEPPVTEVEKPPAEISSLTGGTWTHLLPYEGYTYQRTIIFREDGTISLFGGWLSSELDESYEGTYVLTETEAADGGCTFQIALKGGWVTIGENGYAVEDESYEFLLHVYSPETGGDTGALQMYMGYAAGEKCPPFFGDEASLFTFTPDAG